MDNVKIQEMSGVVLAYLGDSVWELYVREFFIKKGYNIKNLNRLVKENVNAKKQSFYLKSILPDLTDEERAIINRAKNGNIKSFPKSCSIMEYREATAFEAYIGVLYINNEIARIKNIIERFFIE